MSLYDDLPLFAWCPPSKVVPFPQAKRIGRARHIAERMAAKSGHAAERYWQITIQTLMRQLDDAGIDRAIIMKEADAFRHAVEIELNRQTSMLQHR